MSNHRKLPVSYTHRVRPSLSLSLQHSWRGGGAFANLKAISCAPLQCLIEHFLLRYSNISLACWDYRDSKQ